MSPHHNFPDSHELHRWARRQRSAALANAISGALKSLAAALSVRDRLEPRHDRLDAGLTHGPQHR
jgi:hypothetical protein